MRRSNTLSVVMGLLAIALMAVEASAQTHSVTGTAVVEIDTSGGGGVSVAYPFTASSVFLSGAHTLSGIPLGVETTSFGAISSALHRLPYFHELDLGVAVLRSGQLSTGGGVSGLELDLASLVLSGSEANVLFISPDEEQALDFPSITLGDNAAAQTGALRSELAPLADASITSPAWSVASNTLTPGGVGTVVLESPISLSTALQSGASIPGQATLTLSFVPEPSAWVGLASGALGLLGLARRSSSSSARRRAYGGARRSQARNSSAMPTPSS